MLKKRDSKAGDGSLLSLFPIQAALSLPIAFSASVEGSVIEMKPAALIPEDNAVSLKAYLAKLPITSEWNNLAKIHESKI